MRRSSQPHVAAAVDDADDFVDEAPTRPFSRELRARVLIIEHDARQRQLVVERMRGEAFDVLEAGSEAEALDVLARASRGAAPIDLLVMDMRKPAASGIEIARQLRASDWMMPIVLIASSPDCELATEAAYLNVLLLETPFALDRLSAAAIAALLGPTRCSNSNEPSTDLV